MKHIKFCLYLFDKPFEIYYGENEANAAMHSLQSIHPNWKMKVKKVRKDFYI